MARKESSRMCKKQSCGFGCLGNNSDQQIPVNTSTFIMAAVLLFAQIAREKKKIILCSDASWNPVLNLEIVWEVRKNPQVAAAKLIVKR